MGKLIQDTSRIMGLMLLAGLLAGCEGLHPYRTAQPQSGLICDPSPEYRVTEACGTQIQEHSKDYDLFFTEFTDQGLQYPTEQEEWKAAGNQINYTLSGLKEISSTPGVEGVSVVVFVHGWKHNASADDGNVRSFRALLQSAALLERARRSNYRVVGIYVGWRGLSIRGEPLSNLSFWTRKATALRVAQGSPRELFNRLRSFKCAQNRAQDAGGGRTGSPGACTEVAGNGPHKPKVRMLMIGHSFGGWILYNAVAGSLIESLTHASDTNEPNSVTMRFADMVVLLNPAFEASRYTPLHRVATTTDYRRYQPPILVSVTTAADWATGTAFPAGRFVNSVFERAANNEEAVATKYTMGHMTQYVTHELHTADQPSRECAGWRPLPSIPDREERERQAGLNLKAEEANTFAFPGMREALDEGWQRTFCGGAQLTHLNFKPNSLIWNVRTDETIMGGHNDITNPALIDFVRQLYHDTLVYPRSSDPAAAPQPVPPPSTKPLRGRSASLNR